ncbi:MAG: hypothetical protein PHN56_03305 [Candidatus Nanoarchaeia archaeon]|nr:hypothetical protein [Candidatus Nanoarchaeia archaeon]
MKWYAISGSWRQTNDKVKTDVINIVKDIITQGNGIITGGALGVDYIATQTIIEFGDPKTQLKLYLPIKLDSFCKHYRKRADEGVITQEQADLITFQLEKIAKVAPNSIFDEWSFINANVESYYARNTKIIEDCDELYAFQVNNSEGTQDAINKAKEMNKKIYLKKYNI